MITHVYEVKSVGKGIESKVNDPQGFKDFLNVPVIINSTSPNYVEPLTFDESKVFSGNNPFLEHARIRAFVAYAGSAPVGRIAAIYDDRFNQYHNGNSHELGLNGKTGFFGFYDSVNDTRVTKALFNQANSTLKSWGANLALGPMDPSLNRRAGVLVSGNESQKGFDGFAREPYIMMPYNPAFQSELIEANGFSKAKDLLAFRIDLSQIGEVTKRMDKLAARITRSKTKEGHPAVRVRGLGGLFEIKRDIKTIGELYNTSWNENWGFTPLTERESREFGIELALFGGKNWTYIAEAFDENSGKYVPAGFMGVLPNYNLAIKDKNGSVTPSLVRDFLNVRNKPSQVRVALMGIKPEFRARGLDALMYDRLAKNCYKFGVKELEQSWMLEDNLPMLLPLIKSLGAEHYKTYRLYKKEI